PEVGLYTRAYRRILRIDPLVPDGVVRLEQPHVREPDLGGQQLRLVTSGGLQEAVNPVKDLFRLCLDVTNWVRRYAAEIDRVIAPARTADDWYPLGPLCHAMASDRHICSPFVEAISL